MKKRFPGFLSGCLTTLTALALSATALAASGQVTFSFANVALDGETKLAAGTTITAANGQQVPSSILYTDAAAAEKHWKRTVDGTSFTYTSQRPETPYTVPPAWRPAWLPEGWELSETFHSTTQAKYRFTGDGGHVSFICAYPDKASIGSTVRHEQTIQNCQQVAVQGYPADLYTE